MLKKFNTRELIFIALMAAFMFVIAFSLGTWLIAITGTPLVGGLIVNLFVSFILILTALTIRKFGVLTLMLLIHSTLSMPTINFGPPGAYKIIIGISLGLLMDIFLLAANYRKWAYYIGALVGFVLVVPVLYWMLVLLGMPAAELLKPFLLILMLVYGIEALAGTFLASLFYNKKFKDSRIARQLRN